MRWSAPTRSSFRSQPSGRMRTGSAKSGFEGRLKGGWARSGRFSRPVARRLKKVGRMAICFSESWQESALSFWASATGILAARCLEDEACHAAFRATMAEELALYETFPLVDWFAEEEAVTADILAADERRAFTMSSVRSARSTLVDDLEQWPARVREAMRL